MELMRSLESGKTTNPILAEFWLECLFHQELGYGPKDLAEMPVKKFEDYRRIFEIRAQTQQAQSRNTSGMSVADMQRLANH